jgi:hypothetical protein
MVDLTQWEYRRNCGPGGGMVALLDAIQSGRARHHHAATGGHANYLIRKSATRSATIMTVMLGTALGMRGKIDASATYRFAVPRTLHL